ncbi:MAG: RNA polymerase sigma factor [Candidatus Polarisedimenticolia bacterium]
MARFPSTAWSVISRATRSQSEESRAALASLCEAYWYPLYSYARACGCRHEDARDLTQSYVVLLLEKDYLQSVRSREGRFRCFLLASFRNFLSKERDRARAIKRGGGRLLLSLDVDAAEARHAAEPAGTCTPETAFERSWALTILERALERLQQEAAVKKKEPEFEMLRDYLTGSEPRVPYSDLARQMRTTETALKALVRRLRQRYGSLLRREIAETLADPTQADAELRHLLSVVRPWEPPERPRTVS